MYKVLTSGPLSSSVPDCDRPSSRSPGLPAPCRAVMLGSQLAILVQGRGETSRPVRQLLDGSFLTGCWTNDSMAGNPANAPSVRSTWLSRQLTIPLVVVLFLTIVRGLVYSRCPRSCLMALSDRGHSSVSSSGPNVPIVIKKGAGGVSPPRNSRGTPSLNTDEKESERRRRRRYEQQCLCRASRSSSPGRSGRLPPLSSTGSCDK